MVPVRFNKYLSGSSRRSSRVRNKYLVQLIVYALIASSLSGLTLITSSSPAHAIAATAVAEVYMDAPFVQGSYAQEYGGVQENFDEITTTASGCTSLPASTTLSNGETMTVVSGTAKTCNDSTYAAYSTTETATVGGSYGNMLSVSSNSQVSFKFSSPQRYIGFWWSGGDDQNSVKFYSHGVQIATLSTATLKSIVGLTYPPFTDTGVVTSTSGSTYYKKYYWNNPGLYSSTTPSSYPAGGSLEPFVYVHAFAQNAQTMDEVRFTQGTTGGFEVDNITGSTQTVPIRSSLTFVNEVTSTNLKWTIKTATNSIYSDYNGSCTSNCAFSQQVYSDNTGNWVVLRYTNTSVVSDTSTVSLVDGIGTFTVPALVSSFTYLIVGGGGGGGYDAGGGGGGGGIETGTVTGLSQGDTFTITVGSGGLGGGACNNPLTFGVSAHTTNSGSGNCSSSIPNGKAYYYSDSCTYKNTSGISKTDANLGQNGMNGHSSSLIGAHSTNLSSYGGGGGGGRCQPGNSSGNIANSGGAGEKCFASNGFNNIDTKTSTSCTNTSAGTQPGVTYNIGGGASFFTGGGGWGGIEPSAKSPNVLIFTYPNRANEHGYNFDEELEDGSFKYTGDGQEGDQDPDFGGNKAILEHRKKGRALRLFEESDQKTFVRYIGEFELADSEPEVNRAPDKNGQERNVLVFHLVPVGRTKPLTRKIKKQVSASVSRQRAERNVGESHQRTISAATTTATRQEGQLQKRYEDYLRGKGLDIDTLMITIPESNAPLRVDLVDFTNKKIIEAKAGITRGYVREAIGQVLDYVYQLKRINGEVWQPVILLPGKPTEDLEKLIQSLGIELEYEPESGF